ncbi:hypothetical protein D7X94_14040 [Acutalibacter sp. 1XD8-33]|uniref:hypothetical protein n=1 Tax=Acutalibacter sp. 1XD8-33 TaxID=2320081 RepID=UPI000E9FFB95|nr:hypothetical protein [Acutalibacter sp. 1XD8-33]RKJ39027.1 hypothetical protein D7X94_14040 [Acutalibacter sp. 1XD8-33]
MKDISKTVSRRMEAGELVRADGSRTACRGEVTRLKGQSGGHVPGERHEIGTLCQPVYIFTGSAAGAAPGDILEQGGRRYGVLKAEALEIGGTKVFDRLVLERQVEEDAGQ